MSFACPNLRFGQTLSREAAPPHSRKAAQTEPGRALRRPRLEELLKSHHILNMRSKIFYGWWIVGACFLIAFYVSSIIFYGFTVFFEPLVKEFGWSYTQVSFASSLRGMEMGIISPLIGYLVDRFGSRKLLLSGIIILGFALVLMSFTQSLFMFYCAMMLAAFGGGGCTSVVTMTAVSRWFRRHIGKALGIMSAGFGISGLMLPLVVFLVDSYGWRTALLLFGVGMWIIGIPLSLIVRDSPEKYGYLPDGEIREFAPVQPKIQHVAPKIKMIELLKIRSLFYLNMAECIRFMVLASVVIHIMPHLSASGISRSTSGFIAAAVPLASIIGRFAFGWLGDVFDKRMVTSVAFCFMAAGMGALNFVSTSWGLGLFFLTFPIGFGGLSVLRGTILRQYYDSSVFGSMMGIMMGFAAVGGIIGPTLTGWLFDMTGNYRIIWIIFALLLLVAILFILGMKPQSESKG
ncbi:MAG: MFS transporter [Syntrophales bacterium]|jgi:MFS family permease|nr:MFS transporter [Syntrophales bacterium]MDY0045557.1 MFS transporter [Syntrophales bacterium]